MLSYCDLEVGKNGDLIVVRLGKHPVLDELTVNKINDELLGVADRPDCHRLLLDFSGVACLSSAMLAKLVMLHRKMEPKGEKLGLMRHNFTPPVGFRHHKAGSAVRHHGQQGRCRQSG